jgi:hypothetical protein
MAMIESELYLSNQENIEYFKNKIVDVYYTSSRPCVKPDLDKNAKIYGELLCSLNPHKNLLKMLYKLIAQTRDICYGKGERDITYMMIYQWWRYYPLLALTALYSMMFSGYHSDYVFNTYIDVNNEYAPHQNSYGCFKDVKYFCNYLRKYAHTITYTNNDNTLCNYAITILNQRVYDDYKEYLKNGTMPSLACKWVPRENSKYGWIFEKMAIQWIQATDPVILSSINIEQYENMSNVSLKNCKAVIKCKTIYRKVISLLSKQLDLPETKQCNKKWADIKPYTITIDSMFRKNNALFNIDNTFDNRKPTIIDADRRQCAHNIKEHVFIAEMSPHFKLENMRKSYINQCTFSPLQFVKQAIKLIGSRKINGSIEIQQNILYQIGLLNANWRKFSQKCNALDFFIPIVDMSLSMSGDPLYNAIGMSCLIAEKSKIGQRIMVMDIIPTWVNLEGCSGNFVEMVEILYNYTNRNTVANILKTFDTIIDAITMCNSDGNGNKKMDLVFVIFTNESSYITYGNEMVHTNIINSFSRAKLDIPHIIYWNCSPNIQVKPVYGLTNKSAMVSGTNAELLNHFSFIGWSNLYNNNSFDTLENILSNSRYDIMGELFDKYFSI